MSSSGTVEVEISQATFETLSRIAAAFQRDPRELLENAVLELERQTRDDAFRRMGEAMQRLQQESVRNGTSNITMEEIDEEIALVRAEMQAAKSA